MIKGITHAHLGPFWYHSEPSDVPYSENLLRPISWFGLFLQQNDSNTNSEMVPHCPKKGSRLRDLQGTMFRYGSSSFIRAGKEDRTAT